MKLSLSTARLAERIVRWIRVSRLAVCTAALLVLLNVLLSESARGAPPAPTIGDVPFGSDMHQRFDLYLPSRFAGKRPAVILIHGGGWGGGDKRDSRYTAGLAVERGLVAVATNYRLVDGTPNGRWPAALDDVQTVVTWLRNRADAIGVDPNRICALGGSAGGHLSVFLAVRNKPDDARVDCAVDEFGPVDLADFFHGQVPERMFGYVAESDRKSVLRDASPVNFVTKSTVPILIVQGTQDTQVLPEQSEKLRDSLEKAKVPYRYVTFVGGHGFEGTSSAQYTALKGMELDFIARDLPRH